tara:strand:+ start:2271 stop:2678 length:408 start_codon:yes stop_codon:yes gene_type:complete
MGQSPSSKCIRPFNYKVQWHHRYGTLEIVDRVGARSLPAALETAVVRAANTRDTIDTSLVPYVIDEEGNDLGMPLSERELSVEWAETAVRDLNEIGQTKCWYIVAPEHLDYPDFYKQQVCVTAVYHRYMSGALCK